MKPIFKQIQKSFELFYLEEDWDDNGALPMNEKSYSRSIEFLMRLINEIGTDIYPPTIDLTNDGSVDICWRIKNTVRLLINVSENKFSWYGDNYDNDITKGKQKLCYNKKLIKWIKNKLIKND